MRLVESVVNTVVLRIVGDVAIMCVTSLSMIVPAISLVMLLTSALLGLKSISSL